MTLALIAGRGDLPAQVAAALDAAPLVCAYEGVAPVGLSVDLSFRLETLGSFLVTLGERGVTEVCFAGAMDRPVLDPSRLDPETAALAPLFKEALGKGDDGALRVVKDLFERTGFAVRGAQDIAPDLVARPGVHSALRPDARMRRDARIGADQIARMSAQDVGQACIVAGGRVVAMEDAKGTDAMIDGLGVRRRGKSGIVFKGPKAGQTMQIDMPTIGPDTFQAAARAGLKGVVIHAGGVLVLHRARCTALTNEHKLVFWSWTGE